MPRLLLILALLLLPSSAARSEAEARRFSLWAWERSEDLRFLPARVDVVFLSATITLHGGVSVRPRAQPLRVAPHTVVRPLVRVEVREGSSLASLSAHDEGALVQALINGARGGRWLQIDFDARESEQSAYVRLLQRLRREAPGLELSITGLASWCREGSFLERAPVTSVVPQLFRMGVDEHRFRARAAAFSSPCGESVGLAVDEVLRAPAAVRHVYLFNPNPWTAASFDAAVAKVRQ